MCRTTRRMLLAAIFASGPTASFAQTNGTWLTDGTASWSSPANWLGGNAPDGGGTSYLGTPPTFNIAGTSPPTLPTPLLDQPNTTLTAITFDTYITYDLKYFPLNQTTNQITLVEIGRA